MTGPAEAPMLLPHDTTHLQHALRLAREAEQAGNLPVGAVITLGQNIIAQGQNAIWCPRYRGTRHAEIVALEAVPAELWPQSRAMTLYTTLEPCLMCTGAILLHHLGRVVFGASDALGGGSCVLGVLPAYLEQELALTQWIGPALPEACDALYRGMVEKIEKRQAAGLIV